MSDGRILFHEELDKLVNGLRNRGLQPRNPDEPCHKPGCPATRHFDRIDYEDDTGWMLVFDRLLVWIRKDEDDVALDRDEQTIQLKRCYARYRGVIRNER